MKSKNKNQEFELEKLRHKNKMKEIKTEHKLKLEQIREEKEAKPELQRIKSAEIRRTIDRKNFNY